MAVCKEQPQKCCNLAFEGKVKVGPDDLRGLLQLK